MTDSLPVPAAPSSNAPDSPRPFVFERAPAPGGRWRALRRAYLAPEPECVAALLAEMDDWPGRLGPAIRREAGALVAGVRERCREQGGLDAFMQEYDLSSQEGVVLMCLAEALLRIPDAHTADRLIRDKLGSARWDRHLGHSHSLFVNASTWGLLLTGRLVGIEGDALADPRGFLRRLVARGSEPVVRRALREAMGIIAQQFVMGPTIEAALRRAARPEFRGHRFSYDMLGEAALTGRDAERYTAAYSAAIQALAGADGAGGLLERPGISVKLSALHPRFSFAQRERVMAELVPRLRALAGEARTAGIGLTVDAEEADRLELTLQVFAAVYADRRLRDWPGLGLAVQAYQKRAPAVLDWLVGLAHPERPIPVRLVKGAYWDTEIKRAQEQGLEEYPVFTRKVSTDLSYLACARRLLAARGALYPQFATHNAYTLAALRAMAGDSGGFEFQRLHGMGETLYGALVREQGVACRVYAPVGGYAELLPYLVRRLLENGANTSFVNRIADPAVPLARLTADPVEQVRGLRAVRHPRLPLPGALYGPERPNARGINLNDPAALAPVAAAMGRAAARERTATPLVGGRACDGPARPVHEPADRRRRVGQVVEAGADTAGLAMAAAAQAAPAWNARPVAERARVLARAADLLEAHAAELMALCIREGGRCVPDALAELREAVDYCRYYAVQARRLFAPQTLPGPTGEDNSLRLTGRGVFVCISPWNFPLAIFTGQVAAALAAGNAVVAKPASQTPLVAWRTVQLLHAAGVPADVLQFLPGPSSALSEALLGAPALAGVCLTGSTDTARHIQRRLAARPGPIVPLIAETGGQNAMIVDSSALPEQVVSDVLQSAFNSAGQRCSALRVLFLQEEIAPRILADLQGAVAELSVGDPALLATDIGPVIDAAAQHGLNTYIAGLRRTARLIAQVPLTPVTAHGSYVAPCAFELAGFALPEREVFGPVLHVLRYRADELDRVIAAINATGYGLTLGVHSRIEASARHIAAQARVGNIYVNRNMIGAVVGVQPFGGEGLSGTGPKAGGPHYLQRFATERTVSVNTAAVGGNAGLLAGPDED